MSWQAYVDDHLMVDLPGGGMLSGAAIFGQDGNPWATSPGFPIPEPSYVQTLVAGFDSSGPVTLKFGDTKFFQIGGEDGAVLRGKAGQGGITIKKTNSAVVVGIYLTGVQPGDCNVIVENLGDYLIGQGI
mmetsp:Transcript_31224/g.52451  ORF Transcript_31224/g.52451 Transcript_31224/m.52451 type:complete len:130 (-) Transcript_31224:223-612(-)|eukprot:CAMPEP_0198198374 /NCGR_PEP_ID=MMETSP1445-20131203/1848_1 /TAXON_ID=36898 /ORGANISM="Pyramimonas sp., Strain CCMP2087" /LENGTH=129 /DNA_ID=CAMNT_0043867919 /DNA_START=99 /DNA_END=488 /DNA_ORIENTATION=+